MNIMDGITSFLTFVNDNWTAIVVALGLALGLARKIREYVQKTDEEKIEIAKVYIKECILKMITDAELDYEEWKSAGSIKRSQVIQEIYDRYPVLEKVADQEALLAWIDEQINSALEILREVISKNAPALPEEIA